VTAILRAVGVTKRFAAGDGEVTVLADVDLEVHAGELTLLMGPSGSGKTTLLCILAGLLRPSSGVVEVCGQRISDLDEAAVARVRRREVGFVFQTYNLFPALTALDNVALGHRLRGATVRDARRDARAALEAVGLGSRVDSRPAVLSSGQKQRVAVARALAGAPALLLGDEPTAALDGTSAMEVMRLLAERVTPRSAVLVVTHDPRLEPFSHRTIHIEDGRIVGETRRDRAGDGAAAGPPLVDASGSVE
jgi:putative ABC transport system ATP-binding protein